LPTSTVQLICFDLGGVWVRICRDWREAFDLAGVRVDRPIEDMLVDHANDELVYALETGRMNNDAFCAAVAKLTGINVAHIAAAADAWLIEPYPDIEALLDLLAPSAAGGPATACLSNTQDRHWKMMRGEIPGPAALPLDRLDHHFVSHHIGAMKPHDEIYRHVEQATGLAGDAIVFFDDKAENVEAAHRRGWQAFRIDPDNHPIAQARRHLTELRVIE